MNKSIVTILLPIFLVPTLLNASLSMHAQRLACLKNKGFDPKVVYDIGAFRGEWATDINKIFNTAEFFLFEANDFHESYLKKTGYNYFIKLLGDHEGIVPFYTINNTGDSVLKEKTSHYKNGNFGIKNIPMSTLDNVVKKNNLPLPDLIKLDVQGAEKIVMLGGLDILSHAEVIILEISILQYNENAPLFYEMVSFMDNIGYRALDFLEFHYLPTQELFQIDMLFVKKNSFLIRSDILG